MGFDLKSLLKPKGKSSTNDSGNKKQTSSKKIKSKKATNKKVVKKTASKVNSEIKENNTQASEAQSSEEKDNDLALYNMGADVIIKRGNVPNYMSLLTGPRGKMPVTDEEVKQDFAILSVDDEKREAIMLETHEGKTTNRDHAIKAMDLRQRVRRMHYKVTTMTTTRDILRILYEEAESAKGPDSDSNAGELQTHFDDLVKAAISHGSSDIHIEVRRNGAKIRFRKNGNLEDYKEIPVSYAQEFGGVIYRVIAEEKDVTFKPSEPQDAVIDRQLTDTLRMRIRLATMPAYPSGFDMVMRLLPIGVTSNRKELDELGYTPHQLNDIKLAMAQPVGVTIIAGTTGSGKSTTLVTMLGKVIDDKAGTVKVITVEDPPEFELKGATQVPVVRSKKTSGKDTNPFSAAIRAAMRSDPDILLIGETRDHDSCELLIHAVQSGHQVYTTIHAPSAIGIISRLRSLGAPHDVLGSADFISGLIYQTLVQKVCDGCCRTSEQAAEVYMNKGKSYYKDFLELNKRIQHVATEEQRKQIRYKGDGCDQCVKGISGRTVVAEVVVPDHEMISMFGQGRETEALHHWVQNGGVSALKNGIDKMLLGMCDPFDVEHKLGPLTSDIVMEDRVLDLNNERGILGYIDEEELEVLEKPESKKAIENPLKEALESSLEEKPILDDEHEEKIANNN